jgi:hypothetical protein
MVKWSMATKAKTPRRTSGTYTLGRSGFAKISEVEGIATSPSLERDFQDFDRKGLSAADRRRALVRKYGRRI